MSTYTATVKGVTYTDAKATQAALKEAGLPATLRAPSNPNRGRAMPSTRTVKPFDPQLGEVGAWVKLPNGTVGQVWSGGPNQVIVADGTEYHEIGVAQLESAATPAVQVTLEDVSAPAAEVAEVAELIRPSRAARKAWNREIAETARALGRETYAALVGEWDAAQALRDKGVTAEVALARLTAEPALRVVA